MNEEIFSLSTLSNCARGRKRRKVVGRGPGSGHGKTCCRGVKGMGARAGVKWRHGKEGGGVPLHKRVPTRGFSRARFQTKGDVVNFAEINKLYNDGEVVSLTTLREKNFIKGKSYGLKVLGKGTLTKKVTFEESLFSLNAKDALSKA